MSCSGTQESTGGRKPRTYALEPGARVAVGITVQRGEVRFLAIDMRAQELGCREAPLAFSHTAEYYERLSLYLEAFLDDFHLDRNRLLGVGITLPGIIDQTEGRLVMAPTLELWDVPLEELYRYFSRYPVFIENDANASGYAERWMDKGQNNMVYVALERGIGGAIFWGISSIPATTGAAASSATCASFPMAGCATVDGGAVWRPTAPFPGSATTWASPWGSFSPPCGRGTSRPPPFGRSTGTISPTPWPTCAPTSTAISFWAAPWPLPEGAAAGDLLGAGGEDPVRGGQLFPPPGPLRPPQRLCRHGPAVY